LVVGDKKKKPRTEGARGGFFGRGDVMREVYP